MIGLKSIARTALVLSATGALFGCGSSSQDELASGSLPRQETLYLSGQQNDAPGTFNPLAESWMTTWPVSGRFNLMYEPLLTYNSLTGEIESLLGTLVSKNNDSIVVDLNPAAKWSDGEKVTSRDVKFIYTMGSINTSEQISAIHVDTVKSEPAGEVERVAFLINKKQRNNPLSVMDLLQAIRIVPAHVFEPLIEKLGSKDEVKKLPMDQNPVVSGPYALRSADPNKIILERRDDYWGNAALHNGQLPAPKYIVHPIYKNNEHNTIAMRSGNLDASQSYIPRINRKAGAGVHTWLNEPPYFLPGAMPMLIINTMKEPLNDKRFRRALATAIDYMALRKFAVSDYTDQIKPGLIMPTNLEGKYISDEDLAKYGVKLTITDEKERVETVKQMLSEAGYKSVWNDDGTLDHMENAKGEKIPTMYITSPNGWTDWEAMVTIAVEGFVDGGSYWPAMGLGNFDLIMHKPVADVTPSLPWSRFNEIMASRDWQPLGAWAGVNIGRYNQPGTEGFRPEVDKLLSAIPLMKNADSIATAYRELNKIFMEDQPSIPLVYLPEQFYEFSDRVWTNWPTEKNPYAPAQLPWVASGTKTLWNLKLAK